MNRSILISLLAVFGMAACDRPAAVVNVPPAPAPVVVPGPAGPSGPTGATGATGRPGESTAIIVTPPPAASAPAN